MVRKERGKGLPEEAELNEIVQLVGVDSLSFTDRLKLETAKSIREDYLHQNAFHEIDTFTSTTKQYLLLKMILGWHEAAVKTVSEGGAFEKIVEMGAREQIGRFKYVEEAKMQEQYEAILADMTAEFDEIAQKEEQLA